jgi:hypothetical protein
MSDFTVGTLFLTPLTAHVTDAMRTTTMPHLIHALNTKWTVLYIEDEWLHQPTTVPLLCQVSQSAPLLYHTRAEDHGWGYRVFSRGDEVAAFENHYSLDHGMAVALADARLPDHPDIQYFLHADPKGQALYRALLAEVHQSVAYRDALEEQFERKNVPAFRQFDIDDTNLQRLDWLLSMASIGSAMRPEIDIGVFSDCLEIMNFNWLSYHYLNREHER